MKLSLYGYVGPRSGAMLRVGTVSSIVCLASSPVIPPPWVWIVVTLGIIGVLLVSLTAWAGIQDTRGLVSSDLIRGANQGEHGRWIGNLHERLTKLEERDADRSNE